MDTPARASIGKSLSAKAGLLLGAVAVLLWVGWDDGRESPGPRPAPAPDRRAGAAAAPGTPTPAGHARLDLNQASATELTALSGIGPVLAERILLHRAQIGGYTSFEQLLEVRGIGAGRLAALRGSLADPAETRQGPAEAGRAARAGVPRS